MTLLGTLRASRLRFALEREAAIYASEPPDLASWQLVRLNAAWAGSLERSPWARAMRARLSLPAVFESWDTVARVPVQTRADIRLDIAAAGSAHDPVAWRATGGTTAEPFRFPVFPSETREAGLDQWTGRARLGISPSNTLFMIWGHAHLFGVGVRGAVNRLKRTLSDRALGYTRWSAYRLSPEDLHRTIREVAAGKMLIDQSYVQKLAESMTQLRDTPSRLTERDRRVLRLLLEGYSNKEIATELKLSESSAKAALQQLFARTGVRTRSQLVRIALEKLRDEI